MDEHQESPPVDPKLPPQTPPQRIHKYKIRDVRPGIVAATMPPAACILKIEFQGNQLTCWAEVDDTNARLEREFYLAPTGGKVPDGVYIDTVFGGTFVWHLYETEESYSRDMAAWGAQLEKAV